LSTSEKTPTGGKAQAIDVEKLKLPLVAIPDDPAQGGSPGHVAIVPVNEKRELDLALLTEWASSRGTGHTHALTQILLDAVVEPNTRGPTQ
jgi:hypothetical protein